MNENGYGMLEGGMNFMRLWSDYAGRMMQAAAPVSPQATPPEAAREMRSAMLEAWSQAWDQFLRSPQFMTTMQQSMAASVQWRKQFNDCMAEVQHQFQGASRKDVDQIILGLRHLEQRMVDAVERLGARLEALETRLDGIDDGSEAVDLNGRREDAPLKSHRARSAPAKAGKKKTATESVE